MCVYKADLVYYEDRFRSVHFVCEGRGRGDISRSYKQKPKSYQAYLGHSGYIGRKTRESEKKKKNRKKTTTRKTIFRRVNCFRWTGSIKTHTNRLSRNRAPPPH